VLFEEFSFSGFETDTWQTVMCLNLMHLKSCKGQFKSFRTSLIINCLNWNKPLKVPNFRPPKFRRIIKIVKDKLTFRHRNTDNQDSWIRFLFQATLFCRFFCLYESNLFRLKISVFRILSLLQIDSDLGKLWYFNYEFCFVWDLFFLFSQPITRLTNNCREKR